MGGSGWLIADKTAGHVAGVLCHWLAGYCGSIMLYSCVVSCMMMRVGSNVVMRLTNYVAG